MTTFDVIEQRFSIEPGAVDGLIQVYPQFNMDAAFLGMVLCCVAGMALSPLVDVLKRTKSLGTRSALILMGGLMIGCSIWVAHFSATFTSNIPIDSRIDILGLLMPLLLASLFGCPAVICISKGRSNIARVAGAAAYSTVALMASHYLSMETLSGLETMHYRGGDTLVAWFAAPFYMSVAWFAFLAFRQTRWLPRHLGGAFIGIAITGLHFWWMNSTEFFVLEATLSDKLAPYLIAGISIVTAVLLASAFVAVMIYSSFQRLGARLTAEQRLFQLLREQSPDLHLLVDEGGVVISANRAAARYFLESGTDDGSTEAPMEGQLQGCFIGELLPDTAYKSAPGRHMLKNWAGKRSLVSWHEDGPTAAGESIGRMRSLEVLVTRVKYNHTVVYSLLAHDVTERKEEEERMSFLSSAVEASIDAIMICDEKMLLVYINHAARKLMPSPLTSWAGQHPGETFGNFVQDVHYHAMSDALKAGQSWRGQLIRTLSIGGNRIEAVSVSPVFDTNNELKNFVICIRDDTERVQLMGQLQESQKMESIGSLAAGVAHEINTPIQYVSDNLQFIGESFEDISALLNRLQKAAETNDLLGPEELNQALEDCDAKFLLEEFPSAVQQSVDGARQVSKIVRAMKDFSHPSEEKVMSDVNKAVTSTVTIARNEWKYVATLDMKLDEKLPMVPCVIGEISQCILNIVVNAAHAIGDKQQDGQLGNISIATFLQDGHAVIRIADDGPGIPADIQQRIFDPFFTTKEVGRGTGQGLSIARNSIVERHSGSLDLHSVPGKGSTFTIRLPVVEAQQLDENSLEVA